eukprot:10510734-Lingulodinium_polyedra.AAC.1
MEIGSRLRQCLCPSAPAFVSVCTSVHASCLFAPVSMPLDMGVNAVRCKNELRQRRNGPSANQRNSGF